MSIKTSELQQLTSVLGTDSVLLDSAAGTGRLRLETLARYLAEQENAVSAALADKTGENLLDNSRWDDPDAIINQRGQTEYSTMGYAFDRWIFSTNPGNTVTILPEGVKITVVNNLNARLDQFIEYPQRFSNRVVTFSALASEFTNQKTAIAIGVWYLDYSQPKLTKTSYSNDNGLFSVTVQLPDIIDQSYIFRLSVASQEDTIWKAAKLELGGHQTLAHKDASGNWVLNDPPPNKALELAKCQRYQIEVFNKENIGQGYLCTCRAVESTILYGLLPLPTTMQGGGNPTLITDCSPNTPYLSFGIFDNGYEFAHPITSIRIGGVMQHGILIRAAGEGFIQGNDYTIYVNNQMTHQFLVDKNL